VEGAKETKDEHKKKKVVINPVPENSQPNKLIYKKKDTEPEHKAPIHGILVHHD